MQVILKACHPQRMRILAFLLLGIAGGVGAIAADMFLHDKSVRIPDKIPLLGGRTIEPGMMGAVGDILVAPFVAALSPLIGLGLGTAALGATIVEGSRVAAQSLLPTLPDVNPPADVGGYPGMEYKQPGYLAVDDEEIRGALANARRRMQQAAA